MKTTVSVIAALAIASASLIPSAHAGDREWATAGKVMAGVGAGLLLAKAFEPAPTVVHTTTYVTQPAPVQYVVQNAPVVPPAPFMVAQPSYVVVQQQPVYYQPAPVYYQPAPVYVAPAPVYCPPPRPFFAPPVYYRPAVSFHVSLGHGHHRSYGHGHHRGHGGHHGGHGHHGGRR